MQNQIRKVTSIDLVHAVILYNQLSDLIGNVFVDRIGRSVLFYDYPVDTPIDEIRNKEIEKCIVNAMAVDEIITTDDIKFMMERE